MKYDRDYVPDLSINDCDALCQQYLNIVYHNAHGHRLGGDKESKSIAETYGEILYPSVNKLLDVMNLNEHDVFFDLGSGLGKLVTQVFLKSAVREACGIELIPALHQYAHGIAKKIQTDLPTFFLRGRKLSFLQGDFLEIPLTHATVVLVASPCFSPALMDSVENIIENTPSIHTVLSFRPFQKLNRLNFKNALRVECCWDSTLCYIYKS